eukprot:COSAG04_NODE_15794_length_520_cov_0.814727_1_plen_140_part_01
MQSLWDVYGAPQVAAALAVYAAYRCGVGPAAPERAKREPSTARLQAADGINVQLVKDRKTVFGRISQVPRIPELDYKPKARYAESSKEDVLHPLIEASNCILVPGAYFGDEGKGKTVFLGYWDSEAQALEVFSEALAARE